MNWLGKGTVVLLLLSVIIFSCEDEDNELGFRSPDQNFKVVYKEFNLPTSVYQADSLVTSNGSTATTRLLVGSINDGTFGRATATAYTQYFPLAFPAMTADATFERATLALVFDFYHNGEDIVTSQTYEVRALTDSIVNSTTYYTKSSTSIETKSPLGTVFELVNTQDLDRLQTENNRDNAPENDSYDSISFALNAGFGQQLFDAVKASDSVSMATYRTFRRWRKIFKGFAVVPVETDKVVGFDPNNKYSVLTLWYREEGVLKTVKFSLAASRGLMSYSNVTVDRTGTPLSAITGYYTDSQPVGGSRFIHSGGGIVTKVDLSEVYDYFDDIPIKSLNVAELSIVSNEQLSAPLGLQLRAVRPDNRYLLGLKKGLNEVYDSIVYPDPGFVLKHFINPQSAPYADIIGDDGRVFSLAAKSDSGRTKYKGYMTSFLQREVNLTDGDYLRYFSLIPSSPEFGKSLNGFHFHGDSIKLRVYYTTTNQEE